MSVFKPGDASTQVGAQRLARTIEDYWRERGVDCEARMFRTGEFRPNKPAFGVESNVRLVQCADGGWRAVSETGEAND